MLLDTLNTVVKPTINENIPLPALCEAIAESSNKQLALSILTPCGLTVETGGDFLKDVFGVALCISENCKQVNGIGLMIADPHGSSSLVNSFISQLLEVSTLGKVELLRMNEVDGELSQMN